MTRNPISRLRHPLTRLHLLLIVLAALAALVLADGVVSAAPRQQTPSTDATLSSLSLSDVTLMPPFDSATTMYTGTTAPYTVTETTVTATPTNSGANVSIAYQTTGFGAALIVVADGIVPLLALGETRLIGVTVTAEDSMTTKTYEINVTRPQPVALRSISPQTVAPGGTVAVTLDFGDYGGLGGVDEDLPAGFSWVFVPNVDLHHQVTVMPDITDPQELEITLLGLVSTFTYEVTVDDTVTPGIYTLTGIIIDDNSMTHTVLGDTQITVAESPVVTLSPLRLKIDEGVQGRTP